MKCSRPNWVENTAVRQYVAHLGSVYYCRKISECLPEATFRACLIDITLRLEAGQPKNGTNVKCLKIVTLDAQGYLADWIIERLLYLNRGQSGGPIPYPFE